MKDFHRGLMKVLLPAGCILGLVGALFAQRPFRQYPSVEYGDSTPLPPDWQRPGEWAFARLMYPPGPNDGYRGRFDGDWRQGMSLWTQDGPPADRDFAAAVRRLTRVDARSVEQDVNLDDGTEVYNWPWLYAVQVGEWGITQQQADVLRDYLLRGGFFMADDFHGAYEWQMFLKRIRMVFPDRPIVDIPNSDPIFQRYTISTTAIRFQAPSIWELATKFRTIRRAPTTERERGGSLSATIRAASWSPSLSIPISAIRGSGRIARNILSVFPISVSASGSTTSSMP